MAPLFPPPRESGRGFSVDELFAMLYPDLHQLARWQIGRIGRETPFGATSLLHRSYLEMSKHPESVFPDRGRFMAYAAKVMRSVIVDEMRSHQALKRGGGQDVAPLEGGIGTSSADPADLDRLRMAITALASTDRELAAIVELRFFGGFSFAEIAAMRNVSERTVQRHWEKAREYLREQVTRRGVT